ncbi:hypothetical protein [Bacillus toyonensis]
MIRVEEVVLCDGWDIRVNDVFSNPSMPYRLKVKKIELEDGETNLNNAWVHCIAVYLKNKNNVIDTLENLCNRAWYINEFWTK